PTTQTGAAVSAASRAWATGRSDAADGPAKSSSVNRDACFLRRAASAAGTVRASPRGAGSPTTVTTPMTPSGRVGPGSGTNVTSHHGGPASAGGTGRRTRATPPAHTSGGGASAAHSGDADRRAA